MDAWKNLNSTGYVTTDELYTNFGTVKKALENWPAFKVAGFAIYTDASPHAGAALLQDTDYVLEDLDAVKTAEYGEDIYTKLRMINNSTGDIYITYTAIGSYVPADVFQNMLTPYTPATLNISAGNQETDLSVYERGGASEKWNGWRIKVSWTGGVGTFFHLWTGTTYTIDGISIANFICAGTGFVILELDKTNGNWILVQDGTELVHAEYSNGANAASNAIINFQTKIYDNYGAVTTGAGWKFTNPGKERKYIISCVTYAANASSMQFLSKGLSAYTYGQQVAAPLTFRSSSYIIKLAKDEYIDIRESIGHTANANTKIMICEIRS